MKYVSERGGRRKGGRERERRNNETVCREGEKGQRVKETKVL
jgi:hypothetical protein